MGKAGLTLSSDPSKFNCPLSRERCRVCLGSLAKRAWHPTLLLQWKSGPPPSPGPALTWPSQQTTLRPTSEKDYQKATHLTTYPKPANFPASPPAPSFPWFGTGTQDFSLHPSSSVPFSLLPFLSPLSSMPPSSFLSAAKYRKLL